MSRKKFTVDERCQEFVDKLRSTREEKNISTYVLADLTDIAQPNINRMETYQSYPGLKTIMKIASALDLTVTLTSNPISSTKD